MTEPTYYDRLGVPSDASAEELRRAFRAQARRLHPDEPGGDGAAMAALNEAWRVLSDPPRRVAYDRSLMGGRARASGEAGPGSPAGDLVDRHETDGSDDDWPRPRRRFPVLPVVVLVGVFVLIVGTAYARVSSSPEGPTPGPVDGRLERGSCVQVLPGDLVDEVPCGGPRAGTVALLPDPGVACPPATARYVDRSLRTVCVRPG